MSEASEVGVSAHDATVETGPPPDEPENHEQEEEPDGLERE
jgi:hypothetical protein